MEFQIVDKEYGPQIIPGINKMTIDADNAEQAVFKVMNILGIPQKFVNMMGIKAVAIITLENL